MDYQQGKIYRLYSPSRADVGVYYGSTIQKLCERFHGHKGDMKRNKNCSSKSIIEIGDVVIELVEEYPCNNRKELEAREYWWIQNNECINLIKGTYDYTEKRKEYDKKNREEINRKYRERYAKSKQTSETVVLV